MKYKLKYEEKLFAFWRRWLIAIFLYWDDKSFAYRYSCTEEVEASNLEEAEKKSDALVRTFVLGEVMDMNADGLDGIAPRRWDFKLTLEPVL